MSDSKSDPKSDDAGKARAAALRAEIDKLTKPPAEGGKADKPAGKPANPRDYIHQWMADHDKKPKE